MGFRLGVIKGWQSRWYADKNYKEVLAEDFAIRKAINKELYNASVARIEIERVAGTQITVMIHTAKPGIVIGKNGEKVERLRVTLEKLTKKKVQPPKIIEIRNPEVEAILVGRSIAEQLEKRISFRRAMKQGVTRSMKAGAKGVKIVCSGRLGGAEIARTEREVEGSVPLQTLRADIDFAISEAHTTYGTIGIKVWIYRGDVLTGNRRQSTTPIAISSEDRAPRGDRGPRGGGDRRNDRGGPRGGGDRRNDRGGPRPGGGGPRPPFAGGDRGPRPPFNGPRPAGPVSGAPAVTFTQPILPPRPGEAQPVQPQQPAPQPSNPTPAPAPEQTPGNSSES